MFRRAVLAFVIFLIPGFAWATPRVGNNATSNLGKSREKAAQAGQAAKKKTKKLSRYAPIELYQINTKETLMLRFQDDRGRPIKGWKKRFDKFMRCHLTGTVFNMDNRLAHMLYEVGRHYEAHKLEVVSGYRHPKVARNPKSPHKKGLACDFRVPGVSNAALRDYLRKTFDHAGVGYYPNSVFVHLDNRKKDPSAFWIDYSGPGQEASYAENPREDLRTGRADRARPTGDAEGRAEGEDDMAQAGEARAPAAGHGNGGPGKGAAKRPEEVKSSADPFGE